MFCDQGTLRSSNLTRYYCRHFLMGSVTASDHLMFTALVSTLFAILSSAHSLILDTHMGQLLRQLLSRRDQFQISSKLLPNTSKYITALLTR